MNRLFIVLVLVGVGVVGLGFYQGWFQIGSERTEGKSNVTLSMNTDKFQKDTNTAEEKVQGAGRQIKDRIAGPGKAQNNDAELANKSHDGQVVSITGAKLVMTNAEGEENHTHALTAEVKVTCDGKACKAADLKPGMRIRVTTENAEPHTVTRIEALDNNRDFVKGV